MNSLVYIRNDQILTDTLTVAQKFNKSHRDVLRDVRRTLSLIDGEWGVRNFAQTPYEHPQNGQTYTIYTMTEDGFTLLAMSYTGAEAMQFKLDYIREFRRMQEELQRPRELSRLDLIDLAREAELARIQAESEKAALSEQIALQRPKVALYDVAMAADNGESVAVVAKSLGIGPNKLFRWLRDEHILIDHGSRYNLPFQEHIDAGRFTVRQYSITHFAHGIENKAQTLVTPKGMAYIHERWQAAHQTGLGVAK